MYKHDTTTNGTEVGYALKCTRNWSCPPKHMAPRIVWPSITAWLIIFSLTHLCQRVPFHGNHCLSEESVGNSSNTTVLHSTETSVHFTMSLHNYENYCIDCKYTMHLYMK